MSRAPWITENLRGLIVLALLMRKRSLWQELCQSAGHLISVILINSEERDRLGKKWRTRAVILVFVTFIFHATWELLGNLCFNEYDSAVVANVSSSINQSIVTDEQQLISLTLPPIFADYVSYYTEVTVFVLSQQLLGCIIVLSLVLRDILEKINGEIGLLQKDITGANGIRPFMGQLMPETSFYGMKQRSLQRLSEIDAVYCKVLLFGKDLNVFFGTLLLAMYGMDLATCIGYVASLMASVHASLPCLLNTYMSIVIFCSYSTVFFVPLVMAHEEVMRRFFYVA